MLGSVSFNGKGTGTDTVLNSAISCAVLEEDLQAFPAGLETEIGNWAFGCPAASVSGSL